MKNVKHLVNDFIKKTLDSTMLFEFLQMLGKQIFRFVPILSNFHLIRGLRSDRNMHRKSATFMIRIHNSAHILEEFMVL